MAHQAAAPDPAVAAPAPKPRGQRQQPAGRATRAPEPSTESKGDEGPLTITKAREQCWMMSETDKAARADLDKKVKFVEQCVLPGGEDAGGLLANPPAGEID